MLTPCLGIKDGSHQRLNGALQVEAPPLSLERFFSMALEIRRKAALASNVKAFCG